MGRGNHEKKVTEGLVRHVLPVVRKDDNVFANLVAPSSLTLRICVFSFSSSFRRHLVLFELAGGHLVGPDSQHLLGEF